MNGLATRKALHDVTEHCAPGAEPVSTKHAALGTQHSGRVQRFTAPIYGLGTPGEAERRGAARRERRWRLVFKAGIWFVLLGAMFIVGLNTRAHQREAIASGVAYRVKAQNLGRGAMACELDMQENCLVCMHREITGNVIVSNHC